MSRILDLLFTVDSWQSCVCGKVWGWVETCYPVTLQEACSLLKSQSCRILRLSLTNKLHFFLTESPNQTNIAEVAKVRVEPAELEEFLLAAVPPRGNRSPSYRCWGAECGSPCFSRRQDVGLEEDVDGRRREMTPRWSQWEAASWAQTMETDLLNYFRSKLPLISGIDFLHAHAHPDVSVYGDRPR